MEKLSRKEVRHGQLDCEEDGTDDCDYQDEESQLIRPSAQEVERESDTIVCENHGQQTGK